MSSTTMAKGVACSKPTAQAGPPQHQLLRHGMRTPAAFSSDRAPVWRKAQKSARRHQVHARRNNAVVLAAAATDVASTTVQAIKKSVGGDIFVAGGNGQLSARIVQELLRNGFKVTAGVTDAAEAQAGIEFAKRFELIKGDESKRLRLQEVDLSDESSIAEALPRGARVLVAVGDNLGGQKADSRLLDRALSAAVNRNAQQFILVTPLGGGGGGGGFLAGLFGGGGGTSSKQPSKIERQVADSGLDFVIVRAAKSDGVDPSLQETGVTLTPQGSLSKDAQATKSQVAEVVAQVLLQSQTDVLVEVAANPDSPPSSVEQAVAQVLSQCNISEEQQDSEEAQEQDDEEEEEEQEAQPAPKGLGGLFGRTQKIRADPQEESQNGSSSGSLFGGRSKASPDSPVGPQSQKKIESNLVDANPLGRQDEHMEFEMLQASRQRKADEGRWVFNRETTNHIIVFALKGGFQQITGKAKQKAEEVADEADKGSSKSPFAGLFGGAKKAKQEVEDTVEKESSKPKSPVRGFLGGAKKAKQQVEDTAEEESSKPKSPLGGLFGGAKKAKKEVEDTVEEESSKPKSPLGGLFGGAKKARQEAVEVLDAEGNESINPIAGLFGGVKNPKAEAQQKAPSVTGARKSAAKGIAAKGKQAKSAAKQAASSATNGAEVPKKKGGFLQALGIGQESTYADE